MKVRRVLEYEGPAEWIHLVLERCYIKLPDPVVFEYEPLKRIQEISLEVIDE